MNLVSKSCDQTLLLLVLLSVKVSPEVITLIKGNNLTCLLVEDSIYSAIYITPSESTYQQRSLNEISINLDKEWVSINAHQLTFAPVTDLRWQNKFQYSNQTNVDAATVYDLTFLENVKCISMFVSVDKHCHLDIVLKSGNKSTTEHVEGFNEEHSLKKWIRKEIKLDISGNATLTLIKNRKDGNTAGFWAIDKIHYCKEQDSFSLEALSPDVEYICNELYPTNKTGSVFEILQSSDYFGKEYKISCNISEEKYLDCKHHKICVKNKCCCAYKKSSYRKTCSETDTISAESVTSISQSSIPPLMITSFSDVNYNMNNKTKNMELQSKLKRLLKYITNPWETECLLPNIVISSKNKELVLQCSQKNKKSETLIVLYIITKDDGNLRTSKMSVGVEHNKTISVDYNHEYTIIWSIEGCKNATFNVTVFSSIRKLSQKPVTEICSERCTLLLPVFSNISKYIVDILVIKRYRTYNTTLLFETYNSMKNNNGLQKEGWIVNSTQWTRVTIDNQTDAVYININHSSAVFVKNQTFINYVVLNDRKELTMYPITFDWDERNEENTSLEITIIAFVVPQLFIFMTVIVIFHKQIKKICFKTSLESTESRSESVPLQSIVINSEDIRNIKKENFIEVLKCKLEKNELEEEFLTLPSVTDKTTWEAIRSLNKNKNRDFKLHNFPYDHNRVILKELEGVGTNDYINASYINGFDRSKAYIASQGPKFFTLRDFWRMIWQENIESIVMATNFMNDSGNKRLCAEYLPANVDSIFECGSITVTLVSEQKYEYYVKRKLIVRYFEFEREISHIHIKWPSDNFFLYPNDLMPAIKQIRKMYEKSLHPILIHSGFGTTRTGILILCDMALEMLKLGNTINIYYLTKNLREQRRNIINSSRQYILVHLIILEYIMKEKYFSFSTSINDHLQDRNYKNQLKYIKILCDYDKIVRSWLPEGPEYNLPIVFADGYGKYEKYIVSQQLNKNDVNTFWILIADKCVSCVVLLNKIKKNFQLYPCRNTYEDLVIKVECINTKEVCSYVLRTMSLLIYNKTSKIIKHQKNIVIYELKEDTKQSPNFANNILQLICEVKKYNKIIVPCSDRITMCGVFLVLAYIIEKYETELKIDVGNAIRVARRSGIQFVNSPEQVKLIHLCIVKYLILVLIKHVTSGFIKRGQANLHLVKLTTNE
ncbi:receptor-type tyrosine-protein phosphatase alpha-like isoform X3 [Tribolium madens]|uniref:receptor-type tyrosine-protein phosphatase alpha-like isoform X3 n=1 Tax=Tribolium madens TaxID=41895 RepID=UPI001CF7475C|nr:receptor-type tyrosine-protein phosphatase alpha-like isoform X3 [Tribolium madens]